jgi:hypothetical protein
MEIAPVMYGVTMQGGVTQLVPYASMKRLPPLPQRLDPTPRLATFHACAIVFDPPGSVCDCNATLRQHHQ